MNMTCGPCTVPSVCKKCYILLKKKLLHVKQRSKPSKIHSTGGVLVDLFNKTDLTASKPDLLCMLGNVLAISKLSKIVFVVKNTLYHLLYQADSYYP